jgi:hypothetical protein
MGWIVGILAVLVLVPLWQIAISILPIGEYFKHRNAAIETRADDAEFERIRAAVDEDD